MRKICLLVLFIFTIGLSAFAQEETAAGKDKSIGFGAEWSMNSRENFAGGAVLGFSFNLGSSFAVGLITAASYNFTEIFVLEPSAFFRGNTRQNGVFGGGLIFYGDSSSGSLSAGVRL